MKTPMSVAAVLLLIAVQSPAATGGERELFERNRVRAGAARVNITPPVGSVLSGWAARDHAGTGLADPLYARVLVIDDGEKRVALVATDLLGLPGSLVAETRNRIEAMTGVPGSSVMLSASHTHFGPDLNRERDYVDLLPGLIAGAVKLACEDLTNAWVGIGMGTGTGLAFNRRTLKPDGAVVMSWRYPGDGSGLSFGPVDDSVGLIKVVGDDGSAVGGLINFACHPVCGMNRMYDISADYPGYAVGLLERETGGTALFALGTAGNLVPIERDLDSRRWIGTALGAEALRLWQQTRTRGGFRLATEAKELVLPGRGEDADGVRTEIQAMALGDIVLLGLPGEVFTEIGGRIKAGSGEEGLLIFSLANDYIGYIIHAAAHQKGGYEGETTRLAPEAEDVLVTESLALMGRVRERAGRSGFNRPRVEESDFSDFSGRWQEAREKGQQWWREEKK